MQLILVDNGSTDGVTFEMLNSFAAATRFDCRVLQTFERGNSAGRNVAIPHIAGKYVLFVDDDCYVSSDFAARWLDIFEGRDLGYGTGMITRFDKAFSSIGCVEKPDEELVGKGAFVRRGFIQGSNMAFRADCLTAIGGFDVRFGAGADYAGEDWDAGLRASFAGWSGGYLPGPRVAHDHRRTEADAESRRAFYDYGAGAVYAKHALRRGVFRQFVRELRWQPDRGRALNFVRGFFGFMLKSAGRNS